MPNVFAKPTRIEMIEKKSRFIAISQHVAGKDGFEKQLSDLKIKFKQASHICFAYKFTNSHGTTASKFSDDGEPAGTAGKPIMSHLEGNDLMNAAIFVVRFFGGIKLGAGGLVRAYGASAKKVIEASGVEVFHEMETLKLTLPYESQRLAEYSFSKHNVRILSKAFDEKVHYEIEIRKDFKAQLLSLLNL